MKNRSTKSNHILFANVISTEKYMVFLTKYQSFDQVGFSLVIAFSNSVRLSFDTNNMFLGVILWLYNFLAKKSSCNMLNKVVIEK